jgi:hypothetical protein
LLLPVFACIWKLLLPAFAACIWKLNPDLRTTISSVR